MLTPSFSETSALVAVLEKKSFTKAAEQLGLSAARVSELVRNLEERVGVRLVERTTRSVAATEAGERLLLRLRPLLDDYQAALESLNEFRDKPAGTLRLTVAPPAADFVLGPLLARFFSQYPQIEIDVSVDRAFVDIVEGRFDAGIRPGERVARDMIAVPISDEMTFVVAGSPAYLEQHGMPRTPEDLTKHVCIRFRLPNGSIAPWRLGNTGKLAEVDVAGPLSVNEPGLATRAAIDGVGLIQIPQPYIARELAERSLVRVLGDFAQPKIDRFFLYYSSRRQMRPALKVLVEFLRESYRRAPKPEPQELSAAKHAAKQKSK